MTNPYRNEHTVKLDGNEYLLRATFGALVEIEAVTGLTIPKLMEQIGDNNLSVSHIKGIMIAGIKGAGDKVDEAKLEADIVNAGLQDTVQGVVQFLLKSTFGGNQIKKN
jgi:hypothetical protein